MFLSGWTPTTLRLRTVTRSSPYWPPIFMFLMTREGHAEAPMDPGARWNMDPWVARPPLKFHRFTTPVNPRPFVCPVTSTKSPSRKMSTLISWPTSRAVSAVTRTSLRAPNVPLPAFWKCPRSGFPTRWAFFRPNPIWTASYPSEFAVFLWMTVHGPASITVTGTTFPSASNTWVIPNFLPIIPVVIVRTLSFLSFGAGSRPSELDFDLDPGRQIELHQGVDRRR